MGERARRWRGVLVLAAFPAAAAGAWRNPDLLRGWLLLKDDRLIPEQRPDPHDEALVPRHVESCATSLSRRSEEGAGTPFGHAAMYLEGASRDRDAPYPRLRPCAHAAADTADPEHGAGVSVGRWFRNANWIATPSHALFDGGDLAPGERLTRAHFDRTVQRAIGLDMLKGVELHAWPGTGDRSLVAFVATFSIATDFALRYVRLVFCARKPVNGQQMGEVIAFLDDKNHEYATGAPDFAERATWAARPALNDRTRLVFVAEAASGRFLAQGSERHAPVTACLHSSVPLQAAA